MKFDIRSIFENFTADGEFVSAEPISSGHINDTFVVQTDGVKSYVLQRINHEVFRDPPAVVKNKILVTDHLRRQLQATDTKDLDNHVLTFYQTKTGGFVERDDAGNFWNLMRYINDSNVFLKTPDAKTAYEAGKAFGTFLALTSELEPAKVSETLPRFHSMSHRFEQFDESLADAEQERLKTAAELIEFAKSFRAEMTTLEQLSEDGEIPFRVTHNDTKLSNALFASNGEALCVIDLDTVMKGIVHYDFGDAVRTICSGADEDEPLLENIRFNMDYFKAFVKGFVGESGLVLNNVEAEGLAKSATVMTFIIGLRFLTDYLNGDTYFDTSFEEHNLIRARNQFRLVELIEENLDEMNSIVMKMYSSS